jgi:hypothetical protein
MVTVVQCAALIAPCPSPVRGEGWLPRCNALRLLHPTAYPQREGMVTVDDYAALIDPTCILHLTALPQGERGGCRGRLRCAIDPTFILHPTAHPQREGMVVADDYVALIDPTRPYAKVATAPDCRCHIAPLTIDHERGQQPPQNILRIH